MRRFSKSSEGRRREHFVARMSYLSPPRLRPQPSTDAFNSPSTSRALREAGAASRLVKDQQVSELAEEVVRDFPTPGCMSECGLPSTENSPGDTVTPSSRYSEPHAIWEALASDNVRLLSLKWIVGYAKTGQPLARRQELPSFAAIS